MRPIHNATDKNELVEFSDRRENWAQKPLESKDKKIDPCWNAATINGNHVCLRNPMTKNSA